MWNQNARACNSQELEVFLTETLPLFLSFSYSALLSRSTQRRGHMAPSQRSAVDRTRLTVHYERNGMGGCPLSMLPTKPATGTKMETLGEHLVPSANDPTDDPFTFVPSKFVRLSTPVNLKPGDDRNPLLAGHVVVGGAPAAPFVGVVVQLRRFSGPGAFSRSPHSLPV